MTATNQRSLKTALTIALLGIAVCLFSSPLPAQTFDFSIVHSFDLPRMGMSPSSPLLLDNKGVLYGGANSGTSGLVYQINPSGVERPIYTFTGGADGSGTGGLISDSNGNLYGASFNGGDPDCRSGYGDGCGAIVEIDPLHNLSVLHTFTGREGANPYDPLVRDGLGNLYASLELEGIGRNGTIIKLDPQGNLTVLHSFSGPDGSVPNGVILDDVGNLYGTTRWGGTYNDGTVFRLDTAGHFNVLYNFAGGSDGEYPIAPLVRDSVGNVYGVTIYGGDPSCFSGCGTLFKLNVQSRTETVLHNFIAPEGYSPSGGLARDSTGNLYGVTGAGGSYGYGVVFMVDPNSVYSILHEFAGPPDGSAPRAGPILDRADNLYGTTNAGGAYDHGTVYKLTRQ